MALTQRSQGATLSMVPSQRSGQTEPETAGLMDAFRGSGYSIIRNPLPQEGREWVGEAEVELDAEVVSALPAVGALDVKAPEYPVNASLRQPAWLPVQVGDLPPDAEITWKFTGKGGTSSSNIVRYEATEKRRNYFYGIQFEGRVKLLDNFTLEIDSVRLEDVGTYTVLVTTSTKEQAHVYLQAYGQSLYASPCPSASLPLHGDGAMLVKGVCVCV
ncbi:uncharacterized protein LOC129708542 [Leucoraja erinacea]|uniref:uncharacterized protein LOC129708542 n=1 Tax=Leucoraja erinaceus TaxID=7782 RepID=UPI002454B941|nr:uncharacterized protein LOC129708542 [Leucoraja erinacea]